MVFIVIANRGRFIKNRDSYYKSEQSVQIGAQLKQPVLFLLLGIADQFPF